MFLDFQKLMVSPPTQIQGLLTSVYSYQEILYKDNFCG